MPTCYLLAVSQGSSLDQSTNTWSLFGLTEQVQSPQFPIQLPFEIHAHWSFEPDEYEIDFEARLILVPPTGGETVSLPIPLRANTPRHRIRVMGLPPIPSPGNYQICVEWRRRGDTENWTRCNYVWPLTVETLAQNVSSGT